jgi:uncharacterized glyoxalase superfamily protein PhnB
MFECILVLLMSDGTHDELLVEGKQLSQILQTRTLDFAKHLAKLKAQGMIASNSPVHTVDASKCMEVIYE